MRFFHKVSENREIEDITADELYTLICHIMMDIKKKGGGTYKPTTLRFIRFLLFTWESYSVYHPQPMASGSTQDLGQSFFHLAGK